MPEESNKKKAIDIINDFRYARDSRKDWIEEATEDLEFFLGKQWNDNDVAVLEKAGVLVLTVNKLLANMLLLTGIQRQNRSDFKAFPVGEEDNLKSEIVTKLLKNIMDVSEGTYKVSEQFEDGASVGEGWLEPFIDYTYDMITGTFQLKKGNPFAMYPDPTSKEYDLSDAEFIIKFSPDLTKNQLYTLFPTKRAQIDKIKDTKLSIDNVKEDATLGGELAKRIPEEGEKYDNPDRSGSGTISDIFIKQSLYDLTEYYYKNYITKYYVADKQTGKIIPARDKADADDYIDRTTQEVRNKTYEERIIEFNSNLNLVNQIMSKSGAGGINKQIQTINDEVAHMQIETSLIIIERVEPEIRVCGLVGMSTILSNEICWSFPEWKSYPFNRFAAYVSTIPIKNKELMIKGIIRDLKSPQKELNKSETLDLRHFNEVANSGWYNEKGAWVDKKAVEKYGSVPGVVLEYNTGLKNIPQRILPQPSSGYALISGKATQNMKEISGINTDLLALVEGGQASGRAIALRQKQGLIMVQRLFDNLSRSYRLLGRFILSILGKVYTFETAMKVMGETFITQNFSEPIVSIDPETNQPVPQIDPVTGGIAMQVNQERARDKFREILNDSALGKYDIYIGEGINSETTRMANLALLMEMVEKGIPIPPETLIEESNLSASSKEKIQKAIVQAQEQAREREQLQVQSK